MSTEFLSGIIVGTPYSTLIDQGVDETYLNDLIDYGVLDISSGYMYSPRNRNIVGKFISKTEEHSRIHLDELNQNIDKMFFDLCGYKFFNQDNLGIYLANYIT